MTKKDISKLSIEERIVESGMMYFDDGYLGSTNHGVGYYYGRNKIMDMDNIKSEDDLESCRLGGDNFGDVCDMFEDSDEILDNWDDYFDRWFGDCDEFEIIDDGINGGNGYGKFVVNKKERFIDIMVVPCLYSDWGSNKDSDIKIFGFDWGSGEMVREIESDQLSEKLKDKDYYID